MRSFMLSSKSAQFVEYMDLRTRTRRLYRQISFLSVVQCSRCTWLHEASRNTRK